jgi:iron complex transport system substrate-binding protein
MESTILLISPLLTGYLLDLWLGDPDHWPHPVRVFGNLIATGERFLNKGSFRFVKGMLLSAALVILVFLFFTMLNNALRPYPGLFWLVNGVFVYFGLANKNLIAEGQQVFLALQNSLEAGRRQLARIVGRDTTKLNENQVRIAVFETMSENLSDGVVAPLFYYAIAGVPGMMTYKMINTMDSMLGYRNDRYEWFGKFPARVDDVANFIPARITAILMVLLTGSGRGWRAILKYGNKHKSPNAGYPEAALAGILDCRFGGPNVYHGQVVQKPYIGDTERTIQSDEIGRVSSINHQVCLAAVLLLIMGLLASCSTSSAIYEKGDAASATTDLFPEKVKINHANGFSIAYHGNYKTVKIVSPFEKTIDTATFVLLQRGTPRPRGFSDNQIIEIPVRSLVVMSSLHIGLVGFLEAEEVLTGMGNLKYVSSPKVLGRISAGKIAEVGKDQGLNEELLISMHPDLIMATGSPVSRMARYLAMNQAGIPVMVNSEWVETTPLGRAEWVKLLAALLNKEALVNQKFENVEKEYKRLTILAKKAKNKPSLITGMNSKDAWFVPNGNSYANRFFQDAGASYHWAGTKATGSLPLSFETVYPIALQADYWLNVSIGNLKTKQDILAKDIRYADFKAFKTNKVYGYHNRTNAQGANDYWESGAVNPHLVLADLVKILHPELLPAHQLIYYKPIN